MLRQETTVAEILDGGGGGGLTPYVIPVTDDEVSITLPVTPDSPDQTLVTVNGILRRNFTVAGNVLTWNPAGLFPLRSDMEFVVYA